MFNQNLHANSLVSSLFHDGGPYHVKISQLLCKRNQQTGLYITGTFIIKELRHESEKNI